MYFLYFKVVFFSSFPFFFVPGKFLLIFCLSRLSFFIFSTDPFLLFLELHLLHFLQCFKYFGNPSYIFRMMHAYKDYFIFRFIYKSSFFEFYALAYTHTHTHVSEYQKNWPPTSVLIWPWTIWWWGSSSAGALGNVEYPFITIASRSTLARSGSTWYGPIYGLNRTNSILMLKWIE